jgi:hypothetical protein
MRLCKRGVGGGKYVEREYETKKERKVRRDERGRES